LNNSVGSNFYETKKTYDKRCTTWVVQPGAIELIKHISSEQQVDNCLKTHHQRDRSLESFFYLGCDALTDWG